MGVPAKPAVPEDVGCGLSAAMQILCGGSSVVTEAEIEQGDAIQAELIEEVNAWEKQQLKRLKAEKGEFTLSPHGQGDTSHRLQSLPNVLTKRVQRAVRQHHAGARARIAEAEGVVKAEERLEKILAEHAKWVQETGAELAKHPVPEDDLQHLLKTHANKVKGKLNDLHNIPDAEERVTSVLDRDARFLNRKNSDAKKPSVLWNVASFLGDLAIEAIKNAGKMEPDPERPPRPSALSIVYKGGHYRIGKGFASKAQVEAAGLDWDLDKRSSAQRSKG